MAHSGAFEATSVCMEVCKAINSMWGVIESSKHGHDRNLQIVWCSGYLAACSVNVSHVEKCVGVGSRRHGGTNVRTHTR